MGNGTSLISDEGVKTFYSSITSLKALTYLDLRTDKYIDSLLRLIENEVGEYMKIRKRRFAT